MSVQFITVTFHQLSSCLVLQVSFVGIEIPVPRERVCVAFPVKYWVKPIDNFDALYKANLFGRFSYLTEIRVILLKDFKILSVKFCRRDFTASCRYDHLVGNIVSWNYVASVFIEDEMSVSNYQWYMDINSNWRIVHYFRGEPVKKSLVQLCNKLNQILFLLILNKS